MEFFDWLKDLTMDQRTELAKEVNISARYLSSAVSARENFSSELAVDIYDSKFNDNCETPLTYEAIQAYVDFKTEERRLKRRQRK